MATELEEIHQFYEMYNIPLSTEWLESCIEWCKDGNLAPNYTMIDIQKMVYQQWLLLDLRDVEVPSLPTNLSNEKKYCLRGSYCLQMMQVVDISKPKLWQLQRIRNNVAKNTEAERDFGKRVLQLTLTDGVQEVEAMEFQPVTCLTINLCPGTKIRITGPLMVRNGRLMLKEENVKYLGGAVDEMRVQFAAENVLARALRLEENPEPHVIDENALEVSDENTTLQINASATNENNAVNQNRNQNQNYQTQPRNNTIANQYNNRTNQNAVSSNQDRSRTQNTFSNTPHNEDIPKEFQVDDDLLRELEADFEEQSVRSALNTKANIVSNLKTNPVVNPKPIKNDRSKNCGSPDLFEDMEVDDLLNDHLDQMDVDQMASKERRGCSTDLTRRMDSYSSRSSTLYALRGGNDTKLVQDLEVSSSVIGKAKPSTNAVITLDDSFEDIDIDSHLDDIDKEMANLPSSTQVRNDLKNRVKSPELKSRKLSSFNPKPVSNSTNLTLKNSRKLTQGTLNFGTSTKVDFNLPLIIGSKSPKKEDNNPFSIFKKPPQKLTNIPEFNSKLKTSFIQPQESCLLRPDSPELRSKHLPNTVTLPPQKPLSFGIADYGSNCLLGTSQTLSAVPETAAPLSPEFLVSPPASSRVLTIEKLKKMMPNIGKGKFKIRGKFKNVAEKLKYTHDTCRLVIIVQDDTEELKVLLHSDLVTSIMEITLQQLMQWKLLALQENVEIRLRIIESLNILYDRLKKLDNVLEIQVTRGEEHPVVINIL